jgi:hypothetical protein
MPACVLYAYPSVPYHAMPCRASERRPPIINNFSMCTLCLSIRTLPCHYAFFKIVDSSLRVPQTASGEMHHGTVPVCRLVMML